MADIAIGIHGGCGTLAKELLSEKDWAETRQHLADSLRAGWAILKRGGRSVEAVEAAIVVMENSPHFNAGHGAALTENSEHELDASIMDGETLGAGALCAVRTIKNPIKAARAIMEKSDLLLIAGGAADDFAKRAGLEVVPNSYFTTQRRIDALASLKAKAARQQIGQASEAERHGTVGAVALDGKGNLAAGTSTGGFNNKPVGRVGDSPIIGAGTYAANGSCAVSCTGMGEIFIRRVAAYDVSARMRYAGKGLREAADAVISAVGSHKIGAGLVSVDAAGQVYAPFNTLGMARGWIEANGKVFVATHQDVHEMGAA